MNDSTSHELAWRSYRRRRNVAVAALLAFVLFLSFAIADVLRGQYWWDIGLFVVLGFFAAWTRLVIWKCPQCGNMFFSRPWRENPFARSCLHCGLPKWSTPNSATRGA